MAQITNFTSNPSIINLGSFNAAISIPFTLTNSNGFNVTIASITQVNVDNATITGASFPLTIGPGGSAFLTLTVQSAGQPVISSAYLQLNLVSFDPFVILVNGQRFTLLTARHNWATPMRETFHWLTDIMQSRNGKEQRYRLREYPRRTIEMDHQTKNNDERLAMDGALYSAAHLSFGVPLWCDPIRVTSFASAGASNVAVTGEYFGTYGYDLYADTLVIMFVPGAGLPYQIYQATTVSTVSLVLKTPLITNIPVGTVVYPLKLVQGAESASIARQTNYHQQLKIPWECYVETANINRRFYAGYSNTVYKGYPTLLNANNYISPVDVAMDRKVFTTDYNVTTVRRRVYDTSPQPVEIVRILLPTRSDIASFFGFLDYCQGMHKPFWRASKGDRDLKLVSAASSGATSITVEGKNYYNYFCDQGGVPKSGRRDFAYLVSFTAGGFFYSPQVLFRVTAATPSGNNTILTLESPLSAAIPLGGAISFLRFSRLDSDSITLDWISSRVVTADLPVKSLQFSI